jgi:hypothetical protein
MQHLTLLVKNSQAINLPSSIFIIPNLEFSLWHTIARMFPHGDA